MEQNKTKSNIQRPVAKWNLDGVDPGPPEHAIRWLYRHILKRSAAELSHAAYITLDDKDDGLTYQQLIDSGVRAAEALYTLLSNRTNAEHRPRVMFLFRECARTVVLGHATWLAGYIWTFNEMPQDGEIKPHFIGRIEPEVLFLSAPRLEQILKWTGSHLKIIILAGHTKSEDGQALASLSAETTQEISRRNILLLTWSQFEQRWPAKPDYETYLENHAILGYNFDPESTVAMMPKTTGSTGLSKTPIITHRNLQYRATLEVWMRHMSAMYNPQVAAMLQTLRKNSGETTIHPYCYLNVESMSADWGQCMVLLAAPYYGLTTLLLEGETIRAKPTSILSAIARYRLDMIVLSADDVRPIFLDTTTTTQYDVSCVRYLVTSSAPLKAGIEHELRRAALPNLIAVLQEYGTTETCVITSGVAELHDSHAPGSCGIVPSDQIDLRIVDVLSGRDVDGPNQCGRTLVKSPAVFKGYYKNEQKTREAFDDNGFYKLDDYAYYDKHGAVFIIDRLANVAFADDANKQRPVVPSIIEQRILATCGTDLVQDVGVIVLKQNESCNGKVQVAAFVVLQPEAKKLDNMNFKTEIIARSCQDAKYDEEKIIFLHFLDAVPRISSKVDRQALRRLMLEAEGNVRQTLQSLPK